MIEITETKVVEVKDSNGQPISKGDPILVRIKNQDIVCRFKAIANGYFVTETLDGAHENKYRQGSIQHCRHISGIREYPEMVDKREAE